MSEGPIARLALAPFPFAIKNDWMGRLQDVDDIPRSIPLRMWRRVVSITLALHQHDASQKSAAMAFDLFLGLLPLAAIAGWVLFHLGGASQQGNAILAGLVNVAPSPAADNRKSVV
jgi:uncharacterized BrkB/YihY/UPF0761 family membrane protein